GTVQRTWTPVPPCRRPVRSHQVGAVGRPGPPHGVPPRLSRVPTGQKIRSPDLGSRLRLAQFPARARGGVVALPGGHAGPLRPTTFSRAWPRVAFRVSTTSGACATTKP